MPRIWTLETWQRFEERTRRRVLAASSEAPALAVLEGQGWAIMRQFSTGFFLASRFLPPAKRRNVELIYAAVRYPDEIVDTFSLGPSRECDALDAWSREYERCLALGPLEAVRAGVPTILAGFAHVVREVGISPVHYRDFLAAMRLDIDRPRFESLDELVERYVYGSAVVVGYFLAHVYGAAPGVELERTLAASRHLGIALQLTNFCRDVAEDHRRGRLYLPLAWLREEGLSALRTEDDRCVAAVLRVMHRLAMAAEEHYAEAAARLDTFAVDTRPAIRACIGVYRRLNERLLAQQRGPLVRLSVPWPEKLAELPPSKYWRLPAAYLGWV